MDVPERLEPDETAPDLLEEFAEFRADDGWLQGGNEAADAEREDVPGVEERTDEKTEDERGVEERAEEEAATSNVKSMRSSPKGVALPACQAKWITPFSTHTSSLFSSAVMPSSFCSG